MPQVNNPHAQKVRRAKQVAKHLKTLHASATLAEVRETLNALLALLAEDLPEIKVVKSHLAKKLSDDISAL